MGHCEQSHAFPHGFDLSKIPEGQCVSQVQSKASSCIQMDRDFLSGSYLSALVMQKSFVLSWKSMTEQPAWICQLDQDVNLRTLVQLPPGSCIINWLFAYRLASDFRPGGPSIQVYNCLFREPLDARMFRARIYDPSQPFISTNLNAIINPRTTLPLEVPEYQTSRLSESTDDLVLRRKTEGHVAIASHQTLQVSWDGPTAFLIKLVSKKVLKGRLWFLGVILKKDDARDLNTYQATEVR